MTKVKPAPPESLRVVQSLLAALSKGKVELRPRANSTDHKAALDWIDNWYESACDAVDKALNTKQNKK